VFDSQAKSIKEDVPAAPVGNLSEFYSAADEFAVVASKGIPNESQSKILELAGFRAVCAAYHI
jgi:hypothetical protein